MLRAEDIEEIASSAWFAYWRTWKSGGSDDPRVLARDVIDALRTHLGQSRGAVGSARRSLRFCPLFSDFDSLPQVPARFHGFSRVDAYDLLAHLEVAINPLFAQLVRLAFEGRSTSEAALELGRSSSLLRCLRRYYRRRLVDACS